MMGSLLDALVKFIPALVVYICFGLVPVVAALYVIYFLLTLPLRRNERAHSFLDLLELGLRQGRTAEAAIADASASQDRSLGARFHLLAAYLERGLRLDQALEHVPRLLPPQVIAMLKAGERVGDLRKVLPACRLSLHGGVSQLRGALNYVLVLSFLATPFTFLIPLVIKINILPKFQQIFADMLGGAQMPALTRFVFDNSSAFVGIQATIFLLVWVVTFAYLGGPRLRSWLARILPGGALMPDWLQLALPWRRKRLQRDFSAMLAVLLEAGVPEAEAVRLAAESTANALFGRRAQRAGELLGQGVKLPEAVRVLDNSGELQWRLANALHSVGGFLKALTGWHDALDAKAFQMEQTAAQLTTTMLVLVNGLIVACIFVGMFLPLIHLLNLATLW